MQTPVRLLALISLSGCALGLWACQRQAAMERTQEEQAAAESASAAATTADDADTVPEEWIATTRVAGAVSRVGGDTTAAIERFEDPRKGLVYRFQRAKIDTPLPVGYPEPTPPGAIDLKRYPSVRRAEVTGTTRPEQGRNSAFWPLFRHIESRGIAMTSPVEMDYHGESFDRPASDELPEGRREQPWTMSFLYRTFDDGPADPQTDAPPADDGRRRVIVRDTQPVTMLSIGVRGDYSAPNRRRALEQLEAWLAENPEWVRVGDPRALYYNDPFVNPMWKWAEVQIPVVFRGTPSPERPN